jgi:hypothetical protein
MLEFLYDWLVIDPADLVAALIVMALACLSSGAISDCPLQYSNF